MFPIKDENPTVRAPIVTIALIVVTALVWLVVQGAGTDPALIGSICALGLVPGELTGLAGTDVVPLGPGVACALGEAPRWYTPVTSIFLHGGWFHVISNLWFLWVFGNNVEDAMGRGRFVAFYLLTGIAAAGAQVLADPGSIIPMVGASGAVSGVMGAYILLYPRVRVHVLLVLGIFFTIVTVPAYAMLAYWFGLQLIGGLVPQLDPAGGIAFWAHVGGFVAGLALVSLFRDRARIAEHRQRAVAT